MPPIPGASWQRWIDRFGIVWAYVQDLFYSDIPNAGNTIDYLAGAFGWLG